MKLVTIASPQPHPGALIEGEVLDFPAAPDELGYASIAALLAGAESAMSLAKALVERVGAEPALADDWAWSIVAVKGVVLRKGERGA
jgi:hypothetical protein